MNIIGIDEAGRGALAGPVVVAGLSFRNDIDKKYFQELGVTDSKKCSEKKRQQLFDELIQKTDYFIAVIGLSDIEEHNILGATFLGVEKTIDFFLKKLQLSEISEIPIFYFDGNQIPYSLKNSQTFELLDDVHQKGIIYPKMKQIYVENNNKNYYFTTVVSGDSHVLEVGSASIIAKVYRDYLMEEYSKLTEFSAWNFKQHKGYATKSHQTAILENGASIIHRLSFLKNYEKN